VKSAHREIGRGLRCSAAQRICFAVFGARGAGDATSSTGPTKSGPGPRCGLHFFCGQGALSAVFGRPGCAGRFFFPAMVRRALFLAARVRLALFLGRAGRGRRMLLPLRGLLDTAQGTVEGLFGRWGAPSADARLTG
jgi:hypothetical protein